MIDKKGRGAEREFHFRARNDSWHYPSPERDGAGLVVRERGLPPTRTMSAGSNNAMDHSEQSNGAPALQILPSRRLPGGRVVSH